VLRCREALYEAGGGVLSHCLKLFAKETSLLIDLELIRGVDLADVNDLKLQNRLIN
jgi:hypothetical protein